MTVPMVNISVSVPEVSAVTRFWWEKVAAIGETSSMSGMISVNDTLERVKEVRLHLNCIESLCKAVQEQAIGLLEEDQ